MSDHLSCMEAAHFCDLRNLKRRPWPYAKTPVWVTHSAQTMPSADFAHASRLTAMRQQALRLLQSFPRRALHSPPGHSASAISWILERHCLLDRTIFDGIVSDQTAAIRSKPLRASLLRAAGRVSDRVWVSAGTSACRLS